MAKKGQLWGHSHDLLSTIINYQSAHGKGGRFSDSSTRAVTYVPFTGEETSQKHDARH